jgi:hypothetical protein
MVFEEWEEVLSRFQRAVIVAFESGLDNIVVCVYGAESALRHLRISAWRPLDNLNYLQISVCIKGKGAQGSTDQTLP